MSTVTIRIASLEQVALETIDALTYGHVTAKNTITFSSWKNLHKILSPNRMAMLKAMTGQPSLTFRQIATLVNRDLKAVHTDATLLINSGILEKTVDGVLFPYTKVRFDFEIQTAA